MPNSGFQRHCVAELNGYYYIIGWFEISFFSHFKSSKEKRLKPRSGGSSPANKIYRLDIANNVIKKLTTELPHDFYMHRIGFHRNANLMITVIRYRTKF